MPPTRCTWSRRRTATRRSTSTFGKSGPAGQLVIVAGKPDAVWAAKGYSSYLYTKEAKDFRDKEIFKFDDASAAQVTIVNSHGTLSFTKGDKWAATFDKKPLPRFAEDKLKDMLRAYKALNADDFADGKSLADVGLDKPEATVTISLKDGAGTYTLLVGKTSTGSNRWAKRADSDTIVSDHQLLGRVGHVRPDRSTRRPSTPGRPTPPRSSAGHIRPKVD